MRETIEDRARSVNQLSAGHNDAFFKDAYAPPPDSWNQTLKNFAAAAQEYSNSKSEKHPFTPDEIAQAGTIAGVELNSNYHLRTLSVLANDVPNCVPSSALEASLKQSGLQIIGLFSGAGGDAQYGPNGVLLRETVLQNSQQSGSAGVDQLSLNDCPFESAVSSLASTEAGQQAIAEMITQNKDGSFNVKFPGAKKSIEVTQKDLKNPALGNSASWANVLEAASYKIDPQTAENGANGLGVTEYMSLLTGHNARGVDITGKNVGDVESALRKLLAHGAVVEGGDATADSPLEKGHAYSILKMTGDTLIIRNPWGNSSASKVEPGVGETKQGVTNLGAGELSLSVQTYTNDLPALFFSEQK